MTILTLAVFSCKDFTPDIHHSDLTDTAKKIQTTSAQEKTHCDSKEIPTLPLGCAHHVYSITSLLL